MTTIARLGIVTVYDARTGLATAPVAAAAWAPARVLRWGWIPASTAAERLRHLTIDDLDPADRARWLTHYTDNPGPGYAVTVVADGITAATANKCVDDALVDLIVEGF